MSENNFTDENLHRKKLMIAVLLLIFGLVGLFVLLATPVQSDSKAQPAGQLVGTWLLTPKGGEDGLTRCADFNVQSIYELNNQTAKLISFEDGGRFQSLFAYTSPGDAERYQNVSAVWSSDGEMISFSDISIDGPFGGTGDDQTESFRWLGNHVIELEEQGNQNRYVRCTGDVRSMFGG